MRTLLTPLLLLAATVAAHAQTYFYIDVIQVQPLQPTPADDVSIHLAGGLSSTFILSPGVWLTAATAIVLALSFPDAATSLPLLGVSALVLVVMAVLVHCVAVLY